MFNRTLNLTRSTLSNFVRHSGGHGGIPGEVRISIKIENFDYATFSMS